VTASATPARRPRALYLLRHAKSSWDDPDLDDHDRPLARRGARAGAAVALHLRTEGIQPALVLCSSALRARETLDLIAPALGDAAVWVEPELYGADVADLLLRLARLPPAVPSVLLIGHAPSLRDLALRLAGGGDAAALSRLRAKMPTAALATLVLPRGAWARLAPGSAELRGFVVPRDLG
jgi:phosphohistidine phosphatase